MKGVKWRRPLLAAVLTPLVAKDQIPVPLCFMIDDRVALVTTETVDDALLQAVRELPPATQALVIDVNTVGYTLSAIEIGEILRARRMEVYVVSECDSACTTLLQGATTRTAERTAVFAVHAAYSGPPDTLEQGRRFEARQLVEWGVDPQFAATYVAKDSGERVLSAAEAKSVGMLTDIVIGGRPDNADEGQSGFGGPPKASEMGR